MPHLAICLLGPFQVSLDGQSLTGFESDKVRALLAYLTVEADRPHRRESLVGLLWPDYPEQSARTNLRRVLANLRQVIGDHQADPPFLEITQQTIQFNSASNAWVDVIAFTELLAAKAPSPPNLRPLEEAVELYRGSFLEGFTLKDSAAFEEWALLTRQQLGRQVLEALHRLAGQHEREGEYEPALQYARRQVELEPWQEEAQRQVMRLLALSGQRGAALAQYEVCRRALAEELGVEPASETTALYERIRAGEIRSEPVTQADRFVRGYELRERLGEGGFAVVYRAYQPQVGRDVAIKIIHPHHANQPDFIRRFEVEAHLVARLEHPYIVPLYDYWREPDGAYLVMRWLRGGSLQAALERGPWKVEAAVGLVDQITAALTAAHQHGIVHRDIKPANILLDEAGNAYLSDFGIAKDLSAVVALTDPGAIKGSPAYVSPEQVESQPVTPLADIYSLGVVLYELLTGAHPFPHETLAALLLKHLNEPLPLVHLVRPDLPSAVDEVIQRATAKDPAQRYPDALALAAAFRQAVTTADHQPLTAAPISPLLELTNPYKGLRPFQEADAGDFFGREALTAQLLARLGEAGRMARFLAVVGPSGSGKSSVVRAGLIPALRRGALPGSENWFMVQMLPGTHPLEELEAALLRIAVNPPESLLNQMREDERGLLRAIRRSLPDDHSELLLVIDQFEEVFTLVEDKTERERFLDGLLAAVTDPRSRLRLVVTLRADFYDRPLLYPALGELMRQHTEVVLPLSTTELERAIAGPAERVGVRLEQGLAAAILGDVSEQPGALPLLQYALTELFGRREDHTLTRAAYKASGGVLGALARRADELYSGLDTESQEAARQLFLRLVTLGEGTEDTRRRVLRTELETLNADHRPRTADSLSPEFLAVGGQPSAVISQVIDLFGRYRLLTFDRDPLTRGPTVEVAHEALLREWLRLREWLNESRDEIRMERQLAQAAKDWSGAGQDPSFLLRGTRLELFEAWAKGTTLALTPQERKYLDESITHREREQAAEAERQAREKALERRSLTTLRALVVVLLLAMLGAIGLTRVAVNQSNIAQAERDNAQTNFRRAEAERLAAEAKGLLLQNGSTEVVALLAIRSLNTQYTAQGDEALVAASLLDYPIREFIGHTDRVKAVDYSPDGRYILTGSGDSTVRLWDVETGRELRRFVGDMQDINSAVFSPDGRFVLTGSRHDHTVRLWDIATGEELRRFSEGNGGAFSLDGQRIYVFSEERASSAMIDLETGSVLHTIPAPQMWRRPETTGYSPDGTLYADIPLDEGIVRIKEVDSGEEILTIPLSLTFENFAFSSDNRYFVITGDNGSAQLWDLRTGELLHTLTGSSQIISLGFSPDNRLIVTGGEDTTVRVWDVQTGQEMRRFRGHTAAVRNVDFSPDGRFVLSGGFDQKALLWEVTPTTTLLRIEEENHDLFSKSLSLSPDGTRIAAGREDGTAVVWDAGTGELIGKFQAGTEAVWFTGFTPDNSRLVTASERVRVWDMNDGAMLRELNLGNLSTTDIETSLNVSSEHILAAYEAADDWTGGIIAWSIRTGAEVQRFTTPSGATVAVMSPDEKLVLAYTYADYLARIFDTATGEEIHAFHVVNLEDYRPSFSPDSRLLFTGGNVISALWDLESGKQLHEIVGPRDMVVSSAFSHDGRYIVTGSGDSTVRIWDSETGREMRRITLPFDPNFVGFSANDDYLFIHGSDNKIHILYTRVQDVVNDLCSRLLRDFTAEEREQYGITDVAPTCP